MQPPKRPATGRQAPPATRRGTGQPSRGGPPQAPKNNLPLILGAAGGGGLLIIILIVAMSGGEEPKKRAAEKMPEKVEGPKKYVPDVSALEAEGKRKCEDGVRLIQPRLNPDPSSPKDRVFADLESGLKLLRDGLAAYKQASDKAGKTYPIKEYEKTRQHALKIFCTEVEREAQKSCDEGLAIIKSNESRIGDTSKLGDDEKQKLLLDLQKATKLISSGMGLFDRSFEVSGTRFETTSYLEALKVARPKILELK